MPSPIFKSKNMDRLDTHENFPAGFREYLENYGWHFSKKMCEFAVSRMKDRNGKKIEPYSKDKVDALLKQYGIELKKDKGYDCVYVCNMALADYFGSSIPNPQYLAMFIRDYINDEDGYDGLPFTCYYADTIGSGTPILWEEMM